MQPVINYIYLNYYKIIDSGIAVLLFVLTIFIMALVLIKIKNDSKINIKISGMVYYLFFAIINVILIVIWRQEIFWLLVYITKFLKYALETQLGLNLNRKLFKLIYCFFLLIHLGFGYFLIIVWFKKVEDYINRIIVVAIRVKRFVRKRLKFERL